MKIYLILLTLLIPLILIGGIIHVPETYADPNDAVYYSHQGDTILVAPGIYQTNIIFGGRRVTLASNFLTTQDTSYISSTIFEPSNPQEPIISFISGEDSTAVVCGFTIRDGQAECGGGIYIQDAGPKLKNLIICNNNSINGSAIYARSYPNVFSPIIEKCTIRNNITFNNSIIYLQTTSPTFRNCSIINNTTMGMTFYIWLSNCEIFDSIISDNTGCGILLHTGAILRIKDSVINNNESIGIKKWGGDELYIENCLISNNSENGIELRGEGFDRIINSIITNNGDSGIQCRLNSSPEIINCTIAFNEGRGIGVGGSLNPLILNCNIFENSNFGISKSIYDDGDPIILYTNVYGSNVANFWNVIPGEGTIEEDPLFIAPEEGDFRLQIESPCINIGIADTIGWNFPLNDFAGYLRISGDIIDMGAFEYQFPYMFGDLDLNGVVQAYDASQTLQIVVDLLTPTQYQFIVADVDGNEEIQAYDASLILQYAIGLITIFPVEARKENFITPSASVSVKLNNNELIFSTKGNLYGFEVEIENMIITKFETKILNTFNENKIALASSKPIKGEFLRISMNNEECMMNNIKLKMVVNTEKIERDISFLSNDNPKLPNKTVLQSAYPNPFNPSTTISFSVKEETNIEVSIFNLKGQKIKTLINERKNFGNHFVEWNGDNENKKKVASGIYFYKLSINKRPIDMKKCLLLK